MRILIIGGGGREHAIIKKLAERGDLEIFAAPGNGGISDDAQTVDIKAADIYGAADFAAANKIDFTVVAPDDPLAAGLVDLLEERNIPSFGPVKAAAEIESSKIFAKNLMQKYNIPTAKFQTAEGYNDALSIIKNCDFPIVIKADGLALGKGVSICGDYAEAEKALRETMLDKKFGASGNRVVIEEFLTGPEVSVLTFTDGKTIAPMVGSMDHKRAADGDKGPNTGGMGAIAPNPFYTKEIADECMKKIFLPTINAMNEEGRKFKGCLYFGLMLTPIGPKVIEYNCRFGDPEAQTVLPLLKTDLFEIMKAVYEERLDEINVEFAPGAAACVVVASGGYPGKYETGFEINGLADCGATVFHAGTKKADGKYFTASGRVLGITATGGDLSEALQKAYGAVEKISFTNMFYRKDIGKYSRMPGGAR